VDRMRREPEAFPRWVGELYLEYHRGTLTSVAKNKQNNRRAEQALHVLELLGVLARQQGVDYPHDELEQLWEVVLLNQFHDILPGTSIGPVYDDSDTEYAGFFAQAEALQRRLAGALAERGSYVVLNAASHARSGLVQLPEGISGAGIVAQTVTFADGRRARAVPVTDIAGLSTVELILTQAAPSLPQESLVVSPVLLENAVLRAEFNEKGQLISLFDKRRGREVIMAGKVGNAFVAHQDIPIDFDAWDIDDYFEDRSWPVDALVSAEVVETGPYRAAIRFEWTYENSRVVQVISLEADAGQLEFDTFVDWQERQTLLKVGFPLDIRTDTSRAETQFGHLSRPTHANTSWERARFETSMHRWVDLSEAGFGVAALNDCKYGYDAKGGTLRLTLIKSPVFPWPEADRGEHRFRYALLVHGGDLQTVHNAASAFNLPLQLLAGTATGRPEAVPVATLDSDQVAIETVKLAQAGGGTVLRLWETQGKAGTVTLTLPRAARISETDLHEVETSVLAEAGSVTLHFRPFQIRTLMIS
jgi:alpha-mannosidase